MLHYNIEPLCVWELLKTGYVTILNSVLALQIEDQNDSA